MITNNTTLMNILTNYFNFVQNNNNINNSIFIFGCLDELINNHKLQYVQEHPFVSTYDIVLNGLLYRLFGSFLIKLVPKSKYVILPILLLSTLISLIRTKHFRILKEKKITNEESEIN